MTWNYRFVDCPSETLEEHWYELKEVYYDDDGKPRAYASACLGTEDKDDLPELVKWWALALEKPILHENDFKGE